MLSCLACPVNTLGDDQEYFDDNWRDSDNMERRHLGQEGVAAQPAAATPAGQLMMTSRAPSSPRHHHYAAERFEESKTCTSTYMNCRVQGKARPCASLNGTECVGSREPKKRASFVADLFSFTKYLLGQPGGEEGFRVFCIP